VLCVTSGWACYVLMTEGPAPPGTAGGARPTPQYLDVPDLVPARMVNAFVYCPRLFYLEWISSQFEPSVDTVEGDWVHRVTDQPTGAAPLPDAGELVAARSLLLSSERLGLVGRLDLVEGAGGGVVPVDTKKGTAPDLPEGAWESDRVQLCIQGMLLQDAGYECDHGFVYYAASRKRVRVSFDDQLRAKALSTVEQLRRVAAGGAVPEPLVDSPKCPRCSLVGICLPDEINALAKRAQRKPRRLVPSDPDPQPAYVTEPGAWVGKSGGRIEVTSSGQMLASFREIDVSQLCLYGNVQVSSQVVRDLLADGAVICWFSYGGWFTGIATGLPSKYAALRLAQYAASTGERSLVLSQAITAGKIKNSRVLLRRNARGDVTGELAALQETVSSVAQATSRESLLGIEGAAARTYFGAFPAMLSPGVLALPGSPFDFAGRNRRPPRDPVNCLLSYLYALLVKDLTVACLAVGLDPYYGFYHRPRYGRPALALDLAEEFRPLVAESVALQVVNNGEVKPSDFIVRAGGVALTPNGRKKLISAYERRLAHVATHPEFGYKVSYRRALEVQARLLGAYLLGEVPAYVPFVTR